MIGIKQRLDQLLENSAFEDCLKVSTRVDKSTNPNPTLIYSWFQLAYYFSTTVSLAVKAVYESF